MRPTTITCQRCLEPAPNSKRGAFRKYHVACAEKIRAEKQAARRLDPDLRERERLAARDRRNRVKGDPVAMGRVRDQQRERQARYRERARLHEEMKADLEKAKVELAVARQDLNNAAYAVNDRFADHERRLKALESGTTKGGSTDAEPEQGNHPIFDRLRTASH